MLKIVAEIKGWNVEGVDWIIGNDEQSAIRSEHDQGWGVVRRLEMNWKVFERAGHKRSPEKKSARQKKVKDEGEESGQN